MLYRFDEFEFCTENRALTKSGSLLKIEPRVLDILDMLLRHRNRIVGRDELVTEIWASSAVSDATINSRISYVRQAIGDSGQQQRLIKTIPQKGFQFVGTVRETKSALTNPDKSIISPLVSTARIDSKRFAPQILMAMAAILITAIGLALWKPSTKGSKTETQKPSIAEGRNLVPSPTYIMTPISLPAGEANWLPPQVPDDFATIIQEQAARGWQIQDLEIHQSNGADYYGGLFIPQDRSNAYSGLLLRHGFQEKRRMHMDSNLRLIDFEVSQSGSPTLYAGVWAPGEGEESLTLPRSAKAFQALMPKMRTKGYQLIDMEMSVQNKRLVRYYSVWRTGEEEVQFTSARSEKEFAEIKTKMATEGFVPFDIEITYLNGEALHAALWKQPVQNSQSGLPLRVKTDHFFETNWNTELDIEISQEGTLNILHENK